MVTDQEAWAVVPPGSWIEKFVRSVARSARSGGLGALRMQPVESLFAPPAR